jgi:hypothetical protein
VEFSVDFCIQSIGLPGAGMRRAGWPAKCRRLLGAGVKVEIFWIKAGPASQSMQFCLHPSTQIGYGPADEWDSAGVVAYRALPGAGMRWSGWPAKRRMLLGAVVDCVVYRASQLAKLLLLVLHPSTGMGFA